MVNCVSHPGNAGGFDQPYSLERTTLLIYKKVKGNAVMMSTNACGKWSSSSTIQALCSTRSRGLFFKDELWKCRLRIHLDIIYLNGIFKQARRYSCWFLKYCPTVDNGLASISIMHQHNFVFILHNDTNNSNTRQQHLIFLLTQSDLSGAHV